MEKIDWGEMLAISSQELKKHKNATRIHEIITELSGLDSWVMEATRKQEELKDTNERLEARKNELAKSVQSIKTTHTDIAAKVESLSVEVKELQEGIDSGCADKVEEMQLYYEDQRRSEAKITEEKEQANAEIIQAQEEKILSNNNKLKEIVGKIESMKSGLNAVT